MVEKRRIGDEGAGKTGVERGCFGGNGKFGWLGVSKGYVGGRRAATVCQITHSLLPRHWPPLTGAQREKAWKKRQALCQGPAEERPRVSERPSERASKLPPTHKTRSQSNAPLSFYPPRPPSRFWGLAPRTACFIVIVLCPPPRPPSRSLGLSVRPMSPLPQSDSAGPPSPSTLGPLSSSSPSRFFRPDRHTPTLAAWTSEGGRAPGRACWCGTGFLPFYGHPGPRRSVARSLPPSRLSWAEGETSSAPHTTASLYPHRLPTCPACPSGLSVCLPADLPFCTAWATISPLPKQRVPPAAAQALTATSRRAPPGVVPSSAPPRRSTMTDGPATHVDASYFLRIFSRRRLAVSIFSVGRYVYLPRFMSRGMRFLRVHALLRPVVAVAGPEMAIRGSAVLASMLPRDLDGTSSAQR